MKRVFFVLFIISSKAYRQTPKMEVVVGSTENVSGITAISKNTSPSSQNFTISGFNKSTNNNGSGVYGAHDGAGNGVYGWSKNGHGVFGFSQFSSGGSGVYGLVYGTDRSGVRGYSENGYGNGVLGEAESGIGVKGYAQNAYTGTGIGGHFSNASPSGYALVTGTGKVGIGVLPNLNVDERLDLNGRLRIRHETSTAGVWFNNSANSTNFLDGAFYGMLSDTQTGIFIGGNWRFAFNNNGNATITGFTQLGNTVPAGAAGTASAPAIKTMLLTGTTASTEGASASVATGLLNSKILSYNVLVQNGIFQFQPEHTDEAGYKYHTFLNNGNIFIRNSATQSEYILSKSFKVLVTYTE